jgi:hypothetical protein
LGSLDFSVLQTNFLLLPCSLAKGIGTNDAGLLWEASTSVRIKRILFFIFCWKFTLLNADGSTELHQARNSGPISAIQRKHKNKLHVLR